VSAGDGTLSAESVSQSVARQSSASRCRLRCMNVRLSRCSLSLFFFLFFFFHHSIFPRIPPSLFFAVSLSLSLSFSPFLSVCAVLRFGEQEASRDRKDLLRSLFAFNGIVKFPLRNAPGRARGPLRIRDGEDCLFI